MRLSYLFQVTHQMKTVYHYKLLLSLVGEVFFILLLFARLCHIRGQQLNCEMQGDLYGVNSGHSRYFSAGSFTDVKDVSINSQLFMKFYTQ